MVKVEFKWLYSRDALVKLTSSTRVSSLSKHQWIQDIFEWGREFASRFDGKNTTRICWRLWVTCLGLQ